MTYKSIIHSMIERAARQKLEEYLEIGCIPFDNNIEMHPKDKMFWNFTITLQEYGKPWYYKVGGYLNELGMITIVCYEKQGEKVIMFSTPNKNEKIANIS